MYWCDNAWRTTQVRLFDMDTMMDVLHNVSPIIQDLHIDSRAEPSFDAEEIDEAVHGDTDIEDRMRDQQEIPMVQKIPSLLNQLVSLPFDRLESIRFDTDGMNAEIVRCLIQLAGYKVRSLNIQAIYQFVTKKKKPLCLVSILDQCPQLETLIDAEPVCKFVIKNHTSLIPSRLENLDLERLYFATTELMVLLLKCPCLRRIRLSSWHAMPITPTAMLEKCPRLEIMIWGHLRYGSPSFYRPEWWRINRTFMDEQALIPSKVTITPGLQQLILDNTDGVDHYACVSPIIHQHYATLTRLSITLYMNSMQVIPRMTVFPIHLERLDLLFHHATQEAIESLIRPLVEHCHHLKSISIRTDFRYADANDVVLPRWFFCALRSLHDLQHLAIEVDNDPNDMVYYLETVAVNNIPLESLYYHGDWMTCMDAIAKTTTLRSLALSTHPQEIDMVPIITHLQPLARLESLAFKHGNGFQSLQAFDCLGQLHGLKRLFIAIQDTFSVQGIRHFLHRDIALETMVLLDLTGDCSQELLSYGLEEALEDAREKIPNVQGGRICPECENYTRRYDM
ncbi:hypothetical protein K492DRAFT_239903 [Lichtheimia hyalospora FSU 10163]|nr:hypothetical protein K492DRAFT_239903 [Lichtheimia hyalospora FSU 10163]